MRLKTKNYEFNSFKIEYLLDEDTGQIAMVLLPSDKTSCFEKRREWLEIPEMVRLDMDKRAWEVGNLVHLSYSKYPQSKGAGETLKYGPATQHMCYKEQYTEMSEGKQRIVTILESDCNCLIQHIVTHEEGDDGVTVQTKFVNHSEDEIFLDLLTSVSLDNLSPFAMADIDKRMVLHRFYGGWSLEGKHREDFLEDLNLERSWMCAFPESEKFGSIGSYPVHRYFPMACIEDRVENVYWGIQLEAPASWQMEVSRDGDCCSFSAGIADVEFGNWSKKLAPGEMFETKKAYVSTGKNLDDVCRQLLNMHHKIVDKQPEIEQSMPIVFNDWCASYGEPSHEKVLRYAEKLKGTPVKYIVIDAGWTESPEKSFGQGGNGDWNYSVKKFPKGLKAIAKEVQKKGFELGIWFEPEVTTVGAKVYEKEYDKMHLTRNGQVINSGGDRSFWDFRKIETRAYLRDKIIVFLKENNITYLKIDYNSSIGIGCDGAESLGEGLRGQIEAVQEFLKEIKNEIPDLIIENCASGGHRLEASFMDLTAMSSFSDAHECRELPYIAANLQRLVLARQNQVWVVLNKYLTDQEIYYRLASGFLGRFCLSGDIEMMSDVQWNIAKNALNLYKEVADIIKYGKANVHRTDNANIHHLEGIQIVERIYQNKCLVVIHSFSEIVEYEYPLELQNLLIQKYQGSRETMITVEENELKIKHMKSDEGVVLLLER